MRAGGSGHAVVELAVREEYSPEQGAAAHCGIFGGSVTVQPAPLNAVVPCSHHSVSPPKRGCVELCTQLSEGTVR